MLDDWTAAPRNLDAEQHFVWDNRLNLFGWRAYLGSIPGRSATPPFAVHARRDDVTNNPPAWIGVGVVDLFVNEHVDYSQRLIEAGVSLTPDVVPGAPHGFERLGAPTETAAAYLRQAPEWVGQAIAACPR